MPDTVHRTIDGWQVSGSTPNRVTARAHSLEVMCVHNETGKRLRDAWRIYKVSYGVDHGSPKSYIYLETTPTRQRELMPQGTLYAVLCQWRREFMSTPSGLEWRVSRAEKKLKEIQDGQK